MRERTHQRLVRRDGRSTPTTTRHLRPRTGTARTATGGRVALADLDLGTPAVRLRPLSDAPQERVIAEQFAADVLSLLAAPLGTDARDGDYFDVAGARYVVVALLARSSATSVRCVVARRGVAAAPPAASGAALDFSLAANSQYIGAL